MQKIMLIAMLLMSHACQSKSAGTPVDKGLIAPCGEHQLTILQNGKSVTIADTTLGLGHRLDYARNYVVQNGYVIMQTHQDLYILRFTDEGEVLSEQAIANENNDNHDVVLYGKQAITTGTVWGSPKLHSWNLMLKYVDVENGETTCVDLLKTTEFTGVNHVPEVQGLSLIGNTLYVLLKALDFKNSSSNSFFLLEYNLDKSKDIPIRTLPIDLTPISLPEEKPTDTTKTTIPIQSPFSYQRNHEKMYTDWVARSVEATNSFVVLNLDAQTTFYVGESVGYLRSSSLAHLVLDRESLRPMALYNSNRSCSPYNGINVVGNMLYYLDSWDSTLYRLDLENPTLQKEAPIKSDGPIHRRISINTYPSIATGIPIRKVEEDSVASITTDSYTPLSISGDTVFYIYSKDKGEIQHAPLKPKPRKR